MEWTQLEDKEVNGTKDKVHKEDSGTKADKEVKDNGTKVKAKADGISKVANRVDKGNGVKVEWTQLEDKEVNGTKDKVHKEDSGTKADSKEGKASGVNKVDNGANSNRDLSAKLDIL